jgi:hypothetical protein
MRAVEKLPPSFKRFHKAGGVVRFAIFDGSEGAEDELVAAMKAALPRGSTFDEGKLRALPRRVLKERAFFGDWCDPVDRSLIRIGNWHTHDGQHLHNPKLKSLIGKGHGRGEGMSGAARGVVAGEGGQFAYAFSNPPYGLRARPTEVQELFDDITAFVVPADQQSTILDWTSTRLPEVSDFFASGMDWWGAFLFTIHVPATGRLTAIAASTSD